MKTSTNSRKMSLPLCLALAFAMLMATVAVASAKPAQHTNQTPGFYRQQVGDLAVTALYDGYIGISPELLHGLNQEEIQALIARVFAVQLKDGVQTAVNAYLISDGKQLILVDAGTGNVFGPTLGKIVENIKAAGYKPEEVDTILLTHMHPDHMSGMVAADGKAAFPKAKVWASKADRDFWLNKEVANAAPEGEKPFFKMAQDAVAPYEAKKAMNYFDAGSEVLPGITALSSAGHTPGHISYLIESNGDKVLVWGDIVHSRAVQFRHPEVSIDFDTDQAKAIASRKDIFEKAAAEKWLVAGAHLPFPGFGHVRTEDVGYEWIPVDYAPYGTAPKGDAKK